MDNVTLLRDRVDPYSPHEGDGRIDAYLGIDIGSVSTNLVLIDEEGRVVAEEPRIPIGYLRHLFGERVDGVLAKLQEEIAKKKRGEKSELLDTLIVYSWPKDIFPDFAQDPADLPVRS